MKKRKSLRTLFYIKGQVSLNWALLSAYSMQYSQKDTVPWNWRWNFFQSCPCVLWHVKGIAQLLFRKHWPMKMVEKLKCHCAYHLVPAQLSTHLFTTKTQKIYSNQMIGTVQFYTTDQIFNTKCFKIYIYIYSHFYQHSSKKWFYHT